MPTDRSWVARYNPERRLPKSRGDWGTPWDVFDALCTRYGERTIDLAADSRNTKCERFFGLDDPNQIAGNAMRQSWAGEHGYLNPPFGTVAGAYSVHDWLNKAAHELRNGMLSIIIMLPGEFDQQWFESTAYTHYRYIDLINPRINFIGTLTGNPTKSMVLYSDADWALNKRGTEGRAFIRPLNIRKLIVEYQRVGLISTIGGDSLGG